MLETKCVNLCGKFEEASGIKIHYTCLVNLKLLNKKFAIPSFEILLSSDNLEKKLQQIFSHSSCEIKNKAFKLAQVRFEEFCHKNGYEMVKPEDN